ncbi:Uncharacterised protein [Kingella potus]|uniref:PsiF repeat n=1 Tax=Kingella potus TaxID=265175 RepID=A0A377QYR6_9NEIS|nr:hypothetical protein [Kingella potus]UOP01689.1 hypothetical protein LVJ84_06025 [Kingella potus]STR00009.1 Uncharacterised protein [Kingella potus]
MKPALLSALFAALVLPAAARAADAFDTERLQRSCTLQRESLLRERNGTPACDELKKQRKKSKAAPAGRPSEKNKRSADTDRKSR